MKTIVSILIASALAFGQTAAVSDITATGRVNFATASHTSPTLVGIGSAKPGTCTAGELYFATDATAGSNLYGCTASNVWMLEAGGGGGSGTVTQIVFSSPLSGGTITTSGTVGCATCVTSAAALALNAIVLGGGLQASAAMASLGTATTVLHGNSSGAPAWAAVSLTADVTGTLPYGSGGTGTGSLITGLVRGGSTFTAAELSGDCATSGSNSVTCSKVNGTSVPTNAAANQLLLTTASATGAWASVPACLDSGGNHLNYNASTNSFTCGSTTSGVVQWTTSGSSIYYNGGNVGIGTTTPATSGGGGSPRTLEIMGLAGQSIPWGQLVLSSPNAGNTLDVLGGIEFAARGASSTQRAGYIYSFKENTSTVNADASLMFGVSNAGVTSTAMTIRSSGNVGIGTTNPAYPVDVAGQIRSSSGGFVFPDATVQTSAAMNGASWPSPTSQLQQLQTSVNSGNLTTYSWNSKPALEAQDYNFSYSPSSPATLSSGSVTISLAPCPQGVVGTDVNHYVYIGGTGTAETMLITGGTCDGTGINAGTISGTIAHSHSAGYTVSSATAGMQEAENVPTWGGASGTKTIHVNTMPLNPLYVYAPTYISYSTKVKGDGNHEDGVVVVGNIGVFDVQSNFELEGMGIQAQSQQASGYGIRLGNTSGVSFAKITHSYFYQLYDAVLAVNADNWTFTDNIVYQATHTGLTVANAAGPDNVGAIIQSNIFFNYTGSVLGLACVYNTSTSVIMTGNWCGGISGSNGWQYGLYSNTNVATAGGLAITGNQFQTFTVADIALEGTNTDINVTGNQINQGGLAGTGILVANGVGSGDNQGSITGNVFQGGGPSPAWTGIGVSGGANAWTVAGNTFINMSNGITLAGSGSWTLGTNNFTSVTAPLTNTSYAGTDWVAPSSIGSGWGNAGSTYANAGYRIEGGRLAFRGLLSTGTTTSGTVIYTIPAGSRPLHDCILGATNEPALGTTPTLAMIGVIATSGNVTILGNSITTGNVSFEGLSCPMN